MSKDFYKPEDIPKISESFLKLEKQSQSLIESFVTHKFATPKGEEHALHGFSRRTKILWRCVRKTFELVPPDLEERPEKQAVEDATVFLHAFYVNVFGACDNLAWLLVSEKNIRKKDGKKLPATQIGIRKKNVYIRQAISAQTCELLDNYEKWFEHIDEFRHSLAHRIPLYVPPYIVNDSDVDDYRRLNDEAWKALTSGNIAESKLLKKKQLSLTKFRPWFTHSHSENSPHMVIHPQLLSDFGAIVEIAEAIISEID